jgi:hypothetical protein
MVRLLHLNGPPGIGKSTIAQMYADGHPWTLNLDIDRLRTFVSGWQDDFERSGRLIRPTAIAMMAAHLAEGQDVVMPQMILTSEELARFESAAVAAGADFTEVFLMDDPESVVARFHARGGDAPTSTGREVVRDVVTRSGGDDYLRGCHGSLVDLARERPGSVVIQSVAGRLDATLDEVCSTVGR